MPGERRVPRPTIWLYRLRTLVGRSTTTQSTEGQSQPSVSSMELHSTLYLPASKSASTCAAVVALAVDLGSPEAVGVQQVPELLAGLDQRQEHHRFAALAAPSHFGGDLLQIRIKGCAQVAHGVKSPPLDGHAM